MPNYKEWLDDEKAKKHQIDMLKMSGIPLELKVRKTLEGKGYMAVPYPYQDVGDENDSELVFDRGTWRELDIWGLRTKEPSLDIGGIKISFFTQILCECKYSSDRDIITFSDEYASSLLHNFPILLNGHTMLGGNLKNEFLLPALAERVTESSSKRDDKKERNFTDTNIYTASEQLISALRYLVIKQRWNERNNYLDIVKTSEINRLWGEWLKQGKAERINVGNGYRISEESIDKFLVANYKPETMIKDFRDIVVSIIYLLIVIDENRGVIEAKLDANYSIFDLKDIGVCLYSHHPQKPERYSSIIGSFHYLPIFISNVTQIPSVLELIEYGETKLMKRMKSLLKDKPYLLPKELLFNEQVNTM